MISYYILITIFPNHPAQWDPFYTEVQTQNAPESTSPRVPAESDCFHGFKQKSNNANAAQSHSFESFRKSMFNQTFERCQEQAIIFLRQRALILYILYIYATSKLLLDCGAFRIVGAFPFLASWKLEWIRWGRRRISSSSLNHEA